jgi:hypothetical protein
MDPAVTGVSQINIWPRIEPPQGANLKPRVRVVNPDLEPGGNSHFDGTRLCLNGQLHRRTASL